MLLNTLDIKQLFCTLKLPVLISVSDNGLAEFLARVKLQSSGVHRVEFAQYIISPLLVLVVQSDVFELNAVVNLLVNIADELESDRPRVKGSPNAGTQPEHFCNKLV